MKNYHLVDCCSTCRFVDDIGMYNLEELVCTWYIDNGEENPEDNHVQVNGHCDYYKSEAF